MHAWWLTQSRITTSLFNCRRNEGSGLNMFNTIGWGSVFGIQPLDICCSSVSVRVLLLSSHLVSTQRYWILIYMIAVLMHRRIRSPSRGPHTLYIFEPQQNLGREFFQSKPPTPHPVIFADRSNAVLLLWFILIATVRPLSVCLFILFRIAWWPSPLGFLLLLFLLYAV